MSTDTAKMAHRSPVQPGERRPPAPLESDKTLESDNVSKSLSSDVHHEEKTREEEKNEEKSSEAKSQEARRLPVETDPENKDDMSTREQEQEQEQQQEQEREVEDNGRERLKRHRREVAGRVWIPEIWGQEELLKDWIDCSAFDASLVPRGISSARAALIEEGRRANSGRLRVENR